ncbi:hypothetical protein ACI2K4_26875 [Micromonospora sp. NPDC050397]|uniref:hypothetical protein n=1 Tax=Micromonospora sp. NPDC050397 TaxID=3364279 RepID=UPI00385024A3
MPGKRNKRPDQRPKVDSTFAVPARPPKVDLTRLSDAVEVPTPAGPVPPVTVSPVAVTAPKAGPPVRGSRTGGVGRGQGNRSARQYAFRRS